METQVSAYSEVASAYHAKLADADTETHYVATEYGLANLKALGHK